MRKNKGRMIALGMCLALTASSLNLGGGEHMAKYFKYKQRNLECQKRYPRNQKV